MLPESRNTCKRRNLSPLTGMVLCCYCFVYRSFIEGITSLLKCVCCCLLLSALSDATCCCRLCFRFGCGMLHAGMHFFFRLGIGGATLGNGITVAMAHLVELFA